MFCYKYTGQKLSKLYIVHGPGMQSFYQLRHHKAAGVIANDKTIGNVSLLRELTFVILWLYYF